MKINGRLWMLFLAFAWLLLPIFTTVASKPTFAPHSYQSCTINIFPASLPNSLVGAPYNVLLSASGGVAPYTFSVTNSALPAGLTLSPEGRITGIATVPGTTSFTVTATDLNGCTGSINYSITIIQSATIEVQAALQTVISNGNNGVVITSPLSLALKVFDTAVVGSLNLSKFEELFLTNTGLTQPNVFISGPEVISTSSGSVNRYTILVPSNDPVNSNIASGSYLVIGQAVVNGEIVYVGGETQSLASGAIEQLFLEVIVTPNGQVRAGKTKKVSGSLLVITEPAFIGSTDEELVIICKSVEGNWESVVKVDMPDGLVSTPGTIQTSVVTNEIKVLEFDINQTGSSNLMALKAISTKQKTVKVTHKIKHKGKERTITSEIPVEEKR
jgi:hypothetical protein